MVANGYTLGERTGARLKLGDGWKARTSREVLGSGARGQAMYVMLVSFPSTKFKKNYQKYRHVKVKMFRYSLVLNLGETGSTVSCMSLSNNSLHIRELTCCSHNIPVDGADGDPTTQLSIFR